MKNCEEIGTSNFLYRKLIGKIKQLRQKQKQLRNADDQKNKPIRKGYIKQHKQKEKPKRNQITKEKQHTLERRESLMRY